MGETLKHALGLCGDHWHPSLLNISAFVALVGGSITYMSSALKFYIKSKIESLWKTKN
jgi:hypothetical protein